MASLAGIVSQHGKLAIDSPKELGSMLKLMRHRGPDNNIIRSLSDDRGALGANEINPCLRKETYCTSLEDTPLILFDGRLFNERPAGQSDLDLFKEYYEKYERNCFKHLDGSLPAPSWKKMMKLFWRVIPWAPGPSFSDPRTMFSISARR